MVKPRCDVRGCSTLLEELYNETALWYAWVLHTVGANCDTEACGQWDAEMHDLVNLLPGSSLDPVSFLVLQPEKADNFKWYTTWLLVLSNFLMYLIVYNYFNHLHFTCAFLLIYFFSFHDSFHKCISTIYIW